MVTRWSTLEYDRSEGSTASPETREFSPANELRETWCAPAARAPCDDLHASYLNDGQGRRVVRIQRNDWQSAELTATLHVHAGPRTIQELALPQFTFTPESRSGVTQSLRDTDTELTVGDDTLSQPLLLREYIHGEAHLDDVAVMIEHSTQSV